MYMEMTRNPPPHCVVLIYMHMHMYMHNMYFFHYCEKDFSHRIYMHDEDSDTCDRQDKDIQINPKAATF